MNGLRLDLSLRQDSSDVLEATYRDEGLSVGADHMRVYGEEVLMEVSYNDLILGRRIGQGACSSVNLAQHRRTGETYAIKLFNIYDRGQASQLYNEILLLTSFSCDALVSLKGAFHDAGSIGVILEYMDRGSLEFLLDSAVHITDGAMASIAYQMAWGLGYLHHEKQIHRDIKPGNALMNSLGQVKLSDFGISKELDHTTAMSNSAVGSYLYMSPERLVGDKYDSSADVWSMGLSIAQLWTKVYPFRKASETPVHLSGELENFDVYSFAANAKYPSTMRPFIRSTLAKLPTERSSCLELIRDCGWFHMHKLDGLESAQMILTNWLLELDRSRVRPPAPSFQPMQPPARASLQSSNHFDLPLRDRDAFEASMSMTWGNDDAMSMSMSLRESMRRPNPFTSSGSMSNSFFQQMQHQQQAQARGGANRAAPYRGGGQETYAEEEYDDDFEEVESYSPPPVQTHRESKFDAKEVDRHRRNHK